MRLEFSIEDLKSEVDWWKKLVHPTTQSVSNEFKPVFNRMSIGRARVAAESRNNKDNKK